ncbi:preprotein translocase subunit SecD [Haladaptatus sp. YSMS36]|uniref:preprotein translocase subunit SecD n=1 Tax=Haladaptatus sp. YSMS36 TaxID=3033384 RepID=UPI0023E82451|nr:preprotein translocase subunit SecD [Haladaptatus sp. YSMS36]
MSALRENWRIVLLVIFVVLSGVALFAPTGSADDGGQAGTADTGPTNLKYGLELSGGTRIRAPLVGMTAEDVDVTPDNDREVEIAVANQLNISRTDVRATPQTRTVEVFTENVTQAQFAQALQAAGLSASEENIRDGVTDETRQTAVSVLTEKINRIGLSGGSVQQVQTTQETFILIEVPNQNRTEVLNLIGDRGKVEIVAEFPTDANGTTEYRQVSMLTQGDFAEIGAPQAGQGNQPSYVPVTLTDEAAQNFSQGMQNFGFTSQQGVQSCRYSDTPDDPGYCLHTVVDGEIVYSASMSTGLAGTIANGDFVKDPGFRMTTTNASDARALQVNLQAGALPTSLDIEGEGTTYFLEPALASEFKLFSLITGIIAVLAVAGMTYLRYGEAKIAAPMVVTALSEVVILLGFAAAVDLALDLSHIAGLIAVIGTGVDDLVIIADEISQSGVTTSRVFRDRFRKAFWVIGAAAVTTIIAMSPLAVLSLGDLQGFAIITIVGVLIGVLVTRPAYGDVLRNLMDID